MSMPDEMDGNRFEREPSSQPQGIHRPDLTGSYHGRSIRADAFVGWNGRIRAPRVGFSAFCNSGCKRCIGPARRIISRVPKIPEPCGSARRGRRTSDHMSSRRAESQVLQVIESSRSSITREGFGPSSSSNTILHPSPHRADPSNRRQDAEFGSVTRFIEKSTDDEANLSAQSNQEKAEARFPQPHEHQGRTRHPEAPAGEGAQEPHRVRGLEAGLVRWGPPGSDRRIEWFRRATMRAHVAAVEGSRPGTSPSPWHPATRG